MSEELEAVSCEQPRRRTKKPLFIGLSVGAVIVLGVGALLVPAIKNARIAAVRSADK